jgi:hypothetical protein
MVSGVGAITGSSLDAFACNADHGAGRGLQQPRLFRPDLIPSPRAVGDGMGRQPGFFGVEGRLAGLSAKGDSLERLSAVVDFEPFRPELERVGLRADRLKGGRPPFDHVLMFKVLTLQAQNNLSDERTKFYLRGRLTWMRFLGLGLGDLVPDANTIWTFREALTKAGAVERLFELLDGSLAPQSTRVDGAARALRRRGSIAAAGPR